MSIAPGKSSRWIVIDDTDLESIKYSNDGWFFDARGSQNNIGNFGPTYNNTQHGIQSNGSLSFPFNGSRLAVYGTTKISNVSNVIDPVWECFIDGSTIGATNPFQFAENNWKLCETPDSMGDGAHLLEVKVTSNGTIFWLDDIQYQPSSSVSLNDSVILIDDSDPMIKFNGWQPLGTTATMTSKAGSTMSFDFIGKSISWFAFIPTELPKNATTATYSIDGGSPVVFNLPGLPPNSNTEYSQLFFTVPDLVPGLHTLVVSHLGTGSQTPLVLDYLIVKNASLPTNSTQSPPPATTQGSDTNSHKNNTPVGAIVGGIIGGCALLTLIIAAILYYRRRSSLSERQSAMRYSHPMSMDAEGSYTASVIPQTIQADTSYAQSSTTILTPHHTSMPSISSSSPSTNPQFAIPTSYHSMAVTKQREVETNLSYVLPEIPPPNYSRDPQ